MINKKVLVTNENGFDVKTITKIVNVASSFDSTINFNVNNNQSDAKSIINLMALNVKQNEELLININGKDEQDAMEQILKVLKECQAI